MESQSLAVPLITATHAHDGTRPLSFRLYCSLLGFLVGVLFRRNDLTTHILIYFYNSVTSVLLLSMLYNLYMTAATFQLMLFRGLLRATPDGDFDLERYFGTGSIMGVSMAFVREVPGVLGPCLLTINMAASVLLFRVMLLCVVGDDMAKEDESVIGVDMGKEDESVIGADTVKEKEAKKEAEYRLMVV